MTHVRLLGGAMITQVLDEHVWVGSRDQKADSPGRCYFYRAVVRPPSKERDKAPPWESGISHVGDKQTTMAGNHSPQGSAIIPGFFSRQFRK